MNRKAVITGATKGIGRAIAEIFAQNGFDLFVCARTTDDLDQMAAYWAKEFPACKLYTYALDLKDKTAIADFSKVISEKGKRVDVLVNNAGVYLPGNMTEEKEGQLEELIQTNVYSAYYVTRHLLPLMLPHKHGHIFNMCSIASLAAYPDAGSYSVSKFALLGFSKVLREEMKTKGLRVTAVLPGNTWSDAWKGATLPADRIMKAEDVAKAIWGCYALSDSAVVEELLIRPQLGDL
ncbi:MAG: SDR family oxidoreductase [Saprospiraceae bacterium]